MYKPICSIDPAKEINPVIKTAYPSAVILKDGESHGIFVDASDYEKFELNMRVILSLQEKGFLQ